MVANLFDARRCYGVALRRLALGAGTLRDRLKLAYLEAAFATVHDDGEPDCPDEIVHRIVDLHRRMTRWPAVKDKSTVSASVDSMTDDEVRAAAEELVSIAEAIERETAVHVRRNGLIVHLG